MSWPLFKVLCQWMNPPGSSGSLPSPADLAAWRELLELARRQQVGSTLAAHLHYAERHGGVPPAVAGELGALRRETARRNMQLHAQAVKLARCLNSAGIEPLFLKGAAVMLEQAEPDYSLRRQLDIDVLVGEADLEAAAQALLADGYGFSPGSGQALIHDMRHASAWNAHHHHLAPLVKPGYAAPVELHRHYLPRSFQAGNPVAGAFENARMLERDGSRFMVPDAVTRMVQIIQGRFIHDGYDRARQFPVRAAVDYIALVESGQPGPEDWQALRSRCGSALDLFQLLVWEMTGYRAPGLALPDMDAMPWLSSLRRRYQHPGWARLLDFRARSIQLALALRHTPGKLPRFLGRRVKQAASAPPGNL